MCSPLRSHFAPASPPLRPSFPASLGFTRLRHSPQEHPHPHLPQLTAPSAPRQCPAPVVFCTPHLLLLPNSVEAAERVLMAPEAWFMDSSDEDQRLPHQQEPNQAVGLQRLADLGLAYWQVNAGNWTEDPVLKRVREERGYTCEDLITCTPEKLPNFEEQVKNFFKEHIHEEDEIRFIIDGSGYFDVRDEADRWIRIRCQKGDLLVVPAGIYHRFTLDTNNYIKALRLFGGKPVWTPYPRPSAEELPARKQYLASHHLPT